MSKQDMIEIEGTVVEALPTRLSQSSWKTATRYWLISPVSSG